MKMGTRCKTFVYDGRGKPLICIFRCNDGHPSGHGKELAEFLQHRKITDGVSLATLQSPQNFPDLSNGIEELAAHLLFVLKSRNIVGNIYIIPPGEERKLAYIGQEYEYHIYVDKIIICEIIWNDRDETTWISKVQEKTIFDGTWKELSTFLAIDELITQKEGA